MQTTKMNTQSKKRGKNANRKTAVPDIAGQEARDAARAEIPEEAPIESQKTADEECPFIDQPAVHPETDVRLLDLNKIVNSTYNPRKNFREDTLLELAESIKQSGVLQPICVRPRDEGFEIVYGERRYWGAAMAGLKFIPALVRNLSDAEAEDAAITENLQREDVRPREEAAAYKRALQSGRHTIESLVGKFGKSEAYIRSRLKLCELIDALAGMLDKEDISVGVATEIAKYPADIQQEVYDDHFAEGCYSSWKTARIKEIARRLYERYMTKLESYNFDKTECLSCQHNTANQVLFKDECAGGCAGCQNRECMIRKNNEFLVQKAVKLLKDDPRTTLATGGETPAAVQEALEQEGYHVEELEYSVYHYDKGPQMPDAPQAEEFESEEDFTEAKEEYEAEMAAFAEETQRLEFDISEGRVRKYAIIGNLDIEIRYEEIEDEEREVTVNEGQDDEHKVFVTVVPPSPLEGLMQQDRRNREICYEHITTDMKRVFLDVKVANKPLQKEEQQMFYYAVMQRVMSDSKLRQCGFRPKEGSYLTDEEQFAAAGRITAKQQAALIRAFLVDYFRSAAPEYRCTDETLLTGMMCRFADLNFAEQSQAVQQQYLETYEKRKARLQEQIDALQAKAEAEEMAVSMREAPDFEPEELPDLLPDEMPDAEPSPEPLIIPMDPDIEPDTRMPEEMKTAA